MLRDSMRSLVAGLIVVVGCKHEAAAPTAASKPEAGPAPATLAPGQKLGFADFWEVASISRTDTPETVKAKWGPPNETTGGSEATLRYSGASVTFRDDRSVQLDFMAYSANDRAFFAAHPSPQFALLGMTCDEAAHHLAFTDKVEQYTTCKHYDKNGYLVDVTMMCSDKLTSLVVVWTPLPADIQPIPDHCGMPKG